MEELETTKTHSLPRLTMPRRLSNALSSSPPSPWPSFSPTETKGTNYFVKQTSAKASKIAQFFSTSPKSKQEAQSAAAALLAASRAQEQAFLNSAFGSPAITTGFARITYNFLIYSQSRLTEHGRVDDNSLQAPFSGRDAKTSQATCSIRSSQLICTQVRQQTPGRRLLRASTR